MEKRFIKCAGCLEDFGYFIGKNTYPGEEYIETLKVHFCCNSCHKVCVICQKQKTHLMTCPSCKEIGFHLH